MKDNMKNFREATDLILKDIYVTDELKRRTLEKCTHKKESIIKTRLTAAVSASLIVCLGIFIYYSHKPAVTNNQMVKSTTQERQSSLSKGSKVQEASKSTGSSDSAQSSSIVPNNQNASENITPETQKNVEFAMKDSNDIPQSRSVDGTNKKNVETGSQNKSIDGLNNKNTVINSQSEGFNVTNDKKVETNSQSKSIDSVNTEKIETDSQNRSTDKINNESNENNSESKSFDVVNENTEIDSQGKGIFALNDRRKTDSQSSNDSVKTSNSVQENVGDVINSTISTATSNSSNIDTNNSELNPPTQVHTSLALVPEQLTVLKAEKHFESKILIPSYIPEGFKLTNVSIPDETQKSVKLIYSSESSDFEILQSKSPSKIVGTEKISIGNNTAYINFHKDEKSNIVTTTISWIMDNVQYTLSGNLQKDTLIKIAKSINN